MSRFHPALRSIAARSAGTVLWCVIIGAGAWGVRRVLGPIIPPLEGDSWWAAPVLVLSVIVVFKVVKEVVVRFSRVYTMDARLLTATHGVFRRTRVEVPLAHVRQAVLDRTFAERCFGLGTICVTTAGSQTIDLAWVAVNRPEARLAAIQEATTMGRPPVVIGLAGGIGSGKSAVARVLAGMNYLVIDSDADAKAVLDRPEVLGQLAQWWGRAVVTADGRADRKAIADIVFAKPEERARLESLVHPLVKAGREALVAQASAQGRPGVVLDAPLLFEAGTDASCDFVLFVEAPTEARAKRVAATRGWDAGELARREKSQIPLEEKRRRSDTIVVNDGPPEALEAKVREALARLHTQPTRRGKLSNP